MNFPILDNNLSSRLPQILADAYGKVHHVKDYGLETSSDHEIWNYVRQRNGTIFSKDMDFYHLLNRFGHPPKIIWIRTGNATTRQIANLLIDKADVVQQFLKNDQLGLLELY